MQTDHPRSTSSNFDKYGLALHVVTILVGAGAIGFWQPLGLSQQSSTIIGLVALLAGFLSHLRLTLIAFKPKSVANPTPDRDATNTAVSFDLGTRPDSGMAIEPTETQFSPHQLSLNHIDDIANARATMFAIIQEMQMEGAQLHSRFSDLETLSRDAASDADNISGKIDLITNEIIAIVSKSEVLTANNNEMARNSSHSRRSINSSSDSVKEALVKVSQLVEAAEQINSFVNTISNIATQTNLLALNATIEAARAGDAGRGFAVVAGEVKALSASVSTATSDISRLVAQIRSIGQEVSLGVDEIGSSVNDALEASMKVEQLILDQTEASQSVFDTLQHCSSATIMINNDIHNVTSVVVSNHAAVATLDKSHLKMSIDTVKLVIALDELQEKCA